jgi:hypothetical protein
MAKKKASNVVVVAGGRGRAGRRGGPRNGTGPRARVGVCPVANARKRKK